MVRFNAHASSAYAFNFTFAFASLLAVILRFVARSQTKAKLALDDWLAVASLLSYYAWIVIMIWGLRWNLPSKLGVCLVTDEHSGGKR